MSVPVETRDTVCADTPHTRYVLSFGANVDVTGGPCAVRRGADARVRGVKRVNVEPHLSVTGACTMVRRELWDELTGVERFERGDRWRVDERIRRLNRLGFDVDELSMTTDVDGTTMTIQPSPAVASSRHTPAIGQRGKAPRRLDRFMLTASPFRDNDVVT